MFEVLNGMDMLYLHAKFRGDPLQPKWTSSQFVSDGIRSNSYVVAVYGPILMQFRAFLQDETTLSAVCKICKFVVIWRYVCC